MTTSTATTVDADGAAPGATNPSSAPATHVASAAMRPMARMTTTTKQPRKPAPPVGGPAPRAAMPAAPAATPVPLAAPAGHSPRPGLGAARVVGASGGRCGTSVVAQASASASA